MSDVVLLSADQVATGAHKILVKDAKRRIKLKNCSKHFGGSGQVGNFIFHECHFVSRPNATWALMLGQSDNKGDGVYYKSPIAAFMINLKARSDRDLELAIERAFSTTAKPFCPILAVALRTGKFVAGSPSSIFFQMMKNHLNRMFDYDNPSTDGSTGLVSGFNRSARPSHIHPITITKEVKYHLGAPAALADGIIDTLTTIRFSTKK